MNRLVLGFHYDYAEGAFGYKTKQEAAEAYCRNHRSKNTPNLSAHSMAKFDKDLLRNDAFEEYAANKRKLEKLKKDFDF